jgi:hypothetical protein
MDPLTIGFEDAFHEANLAPEDGGSAASLVAALRAVIDASPHRVRGAVTVSAGGAQRVEVRRAGETYVLEKTAGRWRRQGSPDPSWSGPVAAALTHWLTSGPGRLGRGA